MVHNLTMLVKVSFHGSILSYISFSASKSDTIFKIGIELVVVKAKFMESLFVCLLKVIFSIF